MKKASMICLITVFVVNICSYAYCNGPFRKLGRGISNIVTCPLELPNRYAKALDKKEGGAERLLMYGLIEGVVMVGVRFFVGGLEVLTFPIPIPEGYQPTLNDPEFFWKGPDNSKELKK